MNQKMPVLFFGHGSPMNAIADNPFTRRLAEVGRALPTPQVILSISAHWLTRGTWVTGMKNPRTIHDFGGFPHDLYQVQYPAQGSPELAKALHQKMADLPIHVDEGEWGLDHGTWSVLRHVFPYAQIPIIQLSLDATQGPEAHLEMGRRLRDLRNQGVLIIGSGNIVHNLRRISWEERAPTPEWASQFDEWVKLSLMQRDYQALATEHLATEPGRLSVPTPDHYDPLMVVLGAVEENDKLAFEWEEFQNSSISMRSISWGLRNQDASEIKSGG